jgi:hypothetical protein
VAGSKSLGDLVRDGVARTEWGLHLIDANLMNQTVAPRLEDEMLKAQILYKVSGPIQFISCKRIEQYPAFPG